MKQNPYAPPTSSVDGPPQGQAVAEQTLDNVVEYFPARRGTDSSAVAMYALMGPLLVAAMLAILGLPNLALPGAFATGVFMWFRRRRQKTRPTAILRVSAGRLSVTDADRRVLLDAALDQVLNVALDTRTIQRVQENSGSSIPALRFADSVVRGAQDESRIEIKVTSHTIFLTDEYLSSIDTTEWFGKMRKLLRRNGWVPESERGKVASAAAKRSVAMKAPP